MTLLAALALLGGGCLPSLAAQDERPSGRQKWLFAAAGAVIVGLPAALSEGTPIELGGCNRPACFAPLAGAVGASVGFIIGLERDERAGRNWVPGPSFSPVASIVELPLTPFDAVPRGREALVLGSDGVVLVREDGSILAREGIRGLTGGGLLDGGTALLSTVDAVYRVGVGRASVAERLLPQGGGLLNSIGSGRWILGGGAGLRRLDVEGGGDDVRLAEVARSQPERGTLDIVWDGDAGVFWELQPGEVVVRSPDLKELARFGLPSGAGTRLSVAGGLGAVAAGRDGVLLFDATPAALRILGRYGDVLEAADVALEGDTLYVAARGQGLVRLDVSDPGSPRPTGVIRNLGTVSAVVIGDAGIYLLGNGRELRLLRSGF